jgi:hypothetical protein
MGWYQIGNSFRFTPMGNEKVTAPCIPQSGHNLARTQAISIGFYSSPCPRRAATRI